MRAEAAFVLALARGDPRCLVWATHHSFSEDRAFCCAEAHQVAALCWWMWRRVVTLEETTSLEATFASLLRRLRDAYLRNLLRNDALLSDLALLDEALAAQGIQALWFKGPWLMLEAYPDPGTRPVGDIDLGIQERDFRGAVTALASVGYEPERSIPRDPASALRRAHHDSQLRFRATGKRPVEMHFRLVNVGPPLVNEGWVWATARELRVGERVLHVPGPEAMLLHLLIHANQHGFAVLRLLHDIRWAIQRDGASLDWGRLLSHVQKLHCRPLAYYGLLLAAEMAAAKVPYELLRVLRPTRARRAVFSLSWKLGNVRCLERRRTRREMEAPLLYLLEMGRLRDKATYLAGVLANSRALELFLNRPSSGWASLRTTGREEEW